jgi:hypothetical protein
LGSIFGVTTAGLATGFATTGLATIAFLTTGLATGAYSTTAISGLGSTGLAFSESLAFILALSASFSAFSCCACSRAIALIYSI